MSLVFSRSGIGSLELEPLPGTLRLEGGSFDRSDALTVPVRVGEGSGGSCEVALNSESFGVAEALALASPCGAGSTSISGDASSEGALVSVRLDCSQRVLVAEISWKGARPS